MYIKIINFLKTFDLLICLEEIQENNNNTNFNVLFTIVSIGIAILSLYVAIYFPKKSLKQEKDFYISERLDKLFSLVNHCYEDVLNLKNDIHLLRDGQYEYLSSFSNYNKKQNEFLSYLNEMEFFSINHRLWYLRLFCSQNIDESYLISPSSFVSQNESNTLFEKLKGDYEISNEIRNNFLFFCMFAEVEKKYSKEIQKKVYKKLENAKRKKKKAISSQKEVEDNLYMFQEVLEKTNSFIICNCNLMKEKKELKFFNKLLNKHSFEINDCIENDDAKDIKERTNKVIKNIKKDCINDSYFKSLFKLKENYDTPLSENQLKTSYFF